MRVLIFARRRAAARWFSRAAAARDLTVEYSDPQTLSTRLRTLEPQTLVYVEVGSIPEKRLLALASRLARSGRRWLGVLDPKGAIEDVAAVLSAGVVDYLGPRLLARGVDAKRLRSVATRCACLARGAGSEATEEAPPGVVATAWPAACELSGPDWSRVRSGRQYVFALMFVELDNQETLRRGHGSESLARFLQVFRDTVGALAAPAGGRIWMWSEFGGLLLFPFDGTRCDAVITAFRAVLNRSILAMEMYNFEVLPSYRIGLHIGATTYRARGETGGIVADAVNTVFHLGQRFARPGQFCLTETVYPFVPIGLREFFVPTGRFEGHEVWRMRQPLNG